MFVSSNESIHPFTSDKTYQGSNFHQNCNQLRTPTSDIISSDSCGYSSTDNMDLLRNAVKNKTASSLSFPLQADAARKDNSAQNVISSTDSEVPNVLSSDSEFGTRSRDRYK